MRTRAFLLGFVPAALIAAAVVAQDGPAIPRLRTLPPIEEALTRRHEGPIRIRLTDVRFRTPTGNDIILPETRIEGDVPARLTGDAPIRLSLLHLTRPLLVMQAGGPEPGIDLFVDIPGPAITVDRIVLDGGAARTLPPVGTPQRPYVWHAEDVNMVLRDLVLGGGLVPRVDIASASMTGAVGHRPFRFQALAGTTRRPRAVEFDLRVDMGLSRLALAGSLAENGDARVTVVADTVAFAELRAFQESLPTAGTGSGRLTLVSAGERLEVDIPGFRGGLGRSRLTAEGRVARAGERWSGALVVDAPEVHAADVKRGFGTELPGGGVWHGRVALDGTNAALQVDARATGTDSAGGTSSFTARGQIRTAGPTRVALDVTADPVRVADTAFVAALRVEGPLDDLAVRGTASLYEPAPALANGPDADNPPRVRALTAELDARVTDPPGAGPRRAAGAMTLSGVLRGAGGRDVPLTAALRGSAELAEDGAVAVQVHVDSIPLAALARPDGVEILGGLATADGTVTGTLGAPRLAAVVRTPDLRLRVDTLTVLGAATADITGPLERPLADLRADLRLAGREGPAATARGTAVLAKDGPLDLRVDATALPLALIPVPPDIRDLRGTAAGSFRVAGTLGAPTLEGALTVADAGLTVPRTGTVAEGFSGRITLRDDRARFEDLTGTVGGGRAALTGEVMLAGERTLDVAFHLERARVMDTDSASLVATAELTARGPLSRPVLGGRVALVEGRVHEDVLVRQGALDADDPPYADYVARVPWLAESRLRRPAAAQPVGQGEAPFEGSIEVAIGPGVAMVDEDSEMRGRGVLTLTPTASGMAAHGIYRVESGFYANYGEIFDVQGGAFWFDGSGISPSIALRAVREVRAPLGSGLGEPARPFHGRFPALEFFAQGSTQGRIEEVRRLSVLPEDRLRLAQLLLTGVEAGLMDGRRYDRLWAPDAGTGLVGERGAHHAVALLFNYVGNESYDFLAPRDQGWMKAGEVTVGAGFPTWITLAPLMEAGVVLGGGAGEAVVTQVVGEGAPGVRLNWRAAGMTLSVFDEPRFRPRAGALFPDWFQVRRRGAGLRWSWEPGG